jgi:hypothetical protein
LTQCLRNEGAFFSDYYLSELLGLRHKGKLGENEANAAFRRLSNRSERAFRSFGISTTGSRTRQLWLFPLFDELHFNLVLCPEVFDDETSGEKLSSSHAFQPEEDKSPLVYVDLLAWSKDLDSPIRGHKKRDTPHRQMERLLDRGEACWGIITNGKVVRLLRRQQVSGGRRFFEVDMETLFEEQDKSSFGIFWALFRADVFVPDANGKCLLDLIIEGCAQFAVRVSEELRENVRIALEEFARGMLKNECNRELLHDISPRILFEQSLIFMYRLLFVLYGESRGLLPIEDRVYRESYSFEALRDLVDNQNQEFRPNEYRLWKSLQALFRLIRGGIETEELIVPPYNGGLFSEKVGGLLEKCRVSDDCMVGVLQTLSRTQPQKRLGRERIAYGELGVEELGAIYEGLLQYEPFVAKEEMAVVETKGEQIILPSRLAVGQKISERIAARTFYLSTWGGSRKQSGTYNTPLKITEWLVKQALEPLVVGKSSEEILQLNILDPAMGSGAFLVSACYFLADAYAAALIAEGKEIGEHIDEETRAEYRRLVADHCIYGVDLNPLAVELAKVSLWLTTIAKGKPLTFLDQNLVCGDSLIGARLEDLGRYPWEAFDKTGEHIKAKASSSQLSLYDVGAFGSSSLFSLVKSFEALEAIGDETLEMIQRKAYLFEQDRKEGSFYAKCKQACDLWCSLWFWPEGRKAPDNQEYHELLQKIFNESCGLSDNDVKTYLTIVRKITGENRFFHWELEFPAMFFDAQGRRENPGFEAVLGNPPWEKIKVLDREFFAAHYPEIANAATADIRDDLIRGLERTDPTLFLVYKSKRAFSENFGRYLRLCGRFPFGSVGDINLYPIFLELSRTLINRNGRCGMIVKSGILSDFSYRRFLDELVSTSSLVICHDFINKKGLFPGVIGNVRFSLLILQSPRKSEESKLTISVLNESIEELDSKDRYYTLTQKDLKLLNPNTHTLPLFYSRKDFEVCVDIYEKNPVLINKKRTISNPWNIEYWGMYHMTNDSGLFAQKEVLLDKGFQKKSSLFVKGDETYVPLLEGKLIYRFDHRFGSFEGIPRESRFGTKAEPNHPTDKEKSNPSYETEPRYWVPLKDLEMRYAEREVVPEPQFAFRGVCNAFTDSRTTIGTIIPPYATSNGVPILIFREKEARTRSLRKIVFDCLFSSFTFDYIARQKITSSNLNEFMLMQIAAPSPERIKSTKLEFNGVEMSAEDWILQKATLLFGGTESILPVLRSLGTNDTAEWNSSKRLDASCFVDAVIAKCYGLNQGEYEYIMTQFPIFEAQEKAIYGEYRSHSLCRKYFDALKNTESVKANEKA